MQNSDAIDARRQSHGVATPWLWRCVIVLLSLVFPSTLAHASKWTVAPLGIVAVDTSSIAVAEMSGVTYLGPSPIAGKHRFAVMENASAKVQTIDVEFSLGGAPISAQPVATLQLSPATLDFEGIAYTNPTRDSVFVAFESTPGVREYSLSTGALLQSVTIPSVFTNRRANRGFESIARNPAGTRMWTANEEALDVDGGLATASTGTMVRLLRMDVSGDVVTSSQQFAYEVQPIHATGSNSQHRSGLSDLVLLPDNTLLALERSFELSLPNPFYQSRIFEIDTGNATDVSQMPYGAGLIGQTYSAITTAHGKSLLWSGQVGGGLGQNLEGLALGPRLESGDWLLVGVVDNSSGADFVSGNTLISFLLSANESADFDEDADVDGLDFLAWQRGFGTPLGADFAQGDADRDGDVDAADLAIWEGAFATLTATAPQSVPEPATVVASAMAAGWLLLRRHAGRDSRA